MTPSRKYPARAGSALVTAMAVMLMLTVLGMSALSTSLSGVRLATHRRDREIAFELAEAGFRHAARILLKEKRWDYTGQGDTVFGDGLFRVEVTTPLDEPFRRRIVSTGRVVSLGGAYTERRVGGLLDLPSAIWSYSIITEKDLLITGQFRTDSAPAGGLGNVHSNQNLTIDNNAIVDGRATAVGTVTVKSATVTGGFRGGAPKIPFPKMDEPAVEAEAEALGIVRGNLSFSSGTHYLKGKLEGDLVVTSSARIVIEGLLWVTGKVDFSGWSYGGDGMLVAEGPVRLTGGNGFTGSETNHLAIVALSNAGGKTVALTIEGQATVRGGLFVPKGKTSLAGEARIYGSLATRELAASGEAHITCNTAFHAPDDLNDPRVRYWEEL